MHKEKDYNYGFVLLRMFMTFEVILAHCMNFSDNGNIILKGFKHLTGKAVPVFMIMSFYLTGKIFFDRNINKFRKRIKNLFYAQVLWAIIYWLVYYVVQCVFSKALVNDYDLFWQVVTGHSPNLNPTMWFQTVLILLTILYFAICYFLDERMQKMFFIALIFLGLHFEYSGLNYGLFGEMRYELCFPLGRFIEMLPYASLGLLISKFNILNLVKDSKIKFSVFIVVNIILLIAVKQQNVFLEGFGYQGLNLLFESLLIFIIAGIISFETLGTSIKNLLIQIGRFTSCIYYSHRLINFFINYLINKITQPTELMVFTKCILIYVVGYALGLAISKLKTKNKLFEYLISN